MTFAEFLALRKEWQRSAFIGDAMVCSVLANVNRDQKKRPQPFTWVDFLPFGNPDQKPAQSDRQTPEEMLRSLQAIKASLPTSPNRKQHK